MTEWLLKINPKILHLVVFLSGLLFLWPLCLKQDWIELALYCFSGCTMVINLHNMSKLKDLHWGPAIIQYDEVGEKAYYRYWTASNIFYIALMVLILRPN